jgi:hypothetical protein
MTSSSRTTLCRMSGMASAKTRVEAPGPRSPMPKASNAVAAHAVRVAAQGKDRT